MDSRIVKLGQGVEGEVFYIRRNNVRLVVKIGNAYTIRSEFQIHSKIYNALKGSCKEHIVKPIVIDAGLSKFMNRYISMKTYESAYAMEYVHGVTLRAYLTTASEPQRRHILNQTKFAFICMWKLGYIHGDAHLGNILVENLYIF